ncbi:Rrf2 family transcriptional regulator [Moritella viscosa]|uniref:Rrf2 family protein n=1 Tax=Moritella viscosa TaxID=80854 RepID=A0A090IAA6_9GAMM|nr:transcriptional regulator, Rrf2 family [Moritella viscosa]SGY83104.1 Rrf2 family protein [Moritella viscosa]SGY83521.1 Rrf2 family protein [Moritella viscosa]SGY83613.1 Rrf2 family protein [Moritella viscosa]SGY84104.1 Rrf2 family protein [Moritella viscosa]
MVTKVKITTYTDFGIRTLMYLSTLPKGQRSSSAEVANVYDASRNHIAKVIAHLSALNYIESSRGKNGGIWLAKPASEINIGQLVRALENNLKGIDANASDSDIVPIYQLKKVLETGIEAFLKTLDQYYLTDLLNDTYQFESLPYTKQA